MIGQTNKQIEITPLLRLRNNLIGGIYVFVFMFCRFYIFIFIFDLLSIMQAERKCPPLLKFGAETNYIPSGLINIRIRGSYFCTHFHKENFDNNSGDCLN